MSDRESENDDGLKDFFISYAGPDRPWAVWVGYELESAGYSVELDVWDWRPGDNFIWRMNSALAGSDRVLALYSTAYFAPERFTAVEWTAVLAESGERLGGSRLVPLRIEEVQPPSILRPWGWRDLFGMTQEAARNELLAATGGPQRPSTRPPFPLPESGPITATGSRPSFASRTLEGHSGAVWALVGGMADDRPVVVSGGDDKVLRVWDLATGTLQAALGHHTDPVTGADCILVENKPVVVSVGLDRVLRIWDLTSGALLGTPHRLSIERAFKYAFKYSMGGVACCRIDGRPIALTMETEPRGVNEGNDNRVRVWDLSRREFEATLFNRPGRGLTGLACTVLDGRPVAVVAQEYGNVRIYDLRLGRQIRPPIRRWGLQSAKGVVCCELDGTMVAIIYGDKADVWDIKARRRLFSLEAGGRAISTAAACGRLKDRPMVCIGYRDSCLRIWDLRSHGLLCTLPVASRVTSVALMGQPDRPVALVGCSDGTVHVWDLIAEIDGNCTAT